MKKTPEEKLAEAMNNLATRLENFQDPVLWQKVISDAAGMMRVPGLPVATPITELPQAQPTQITGIVDSISFKLSDEEREKLVNQIHEAVQPEITAFNEFVREALKDMPAHRLKAIGDKVAAGETPKIKRRRDCVFIDAGGTEAYLGL